MTRHGKGRFSRLNGCQFGFYSEEEILKLSVCEIKELKGLSVLSLGEPNGLHDPRMGTLTQRQQESCATCGNPHSYCPGHIGHIRLVVPIYNPNIFKWIDKILTRKCYNCHHLLFDDETMQIIKHKLTNIDNGYLFDLHSIQTHLSKLKELKNNKISDNIFGKKSNVKKRKKLRKKPQRNHRNIHRSAEDELNSDDSDDGEFDALMDRISESDDSDLSNDGFNEPPTQKRKIDASAKQNLDFLDEGIMRGTRQMLLKLRWSLFELSCHFRLRFHFFFFTKLNVNVINRLIFNKWDPLDQCASCKCVRILFNRSDESHIIQKPIGRRRKIYDRSKVKLVNINDSTQTMSVDKDVTMPVNDVQKHLEALWKTEPFVMSRLFNAHSFKNNGSNHADYAVCSDFRQFFVKYIVVPPNRYRPPNFMGNRITECTQNRQYRNILKVNIAMKELIKQINELSQNPLLQKYTKTMRKSNGSNNKKSKLDRINLDNLSSDDEVINDMESDNKKVCGKALFEKFDECRKKFIGQWELLQQNFNHLTDGTKNAQLSRSNKIGANQSAQGIRQLMEKKQGLFRMFMMGKRVNYAARSVINPDLWVKTNEVGIPLYAAKILTYPERVQSYNYHTLRQAIINGCDVHPGANAIITADNKTIGLSRLNLDKRKAIARTLLSSFEMSSSKSTNNGLNSSTKGGRPAIVLRHLKNNDIVLVNRQPTLHKVSIMAHRARVQHKGKVIRMHYANCNSYNADFDGDEINVHFPQSELARSEAYNIASTTKQYISVKNGAPLRGLMQDHVVSSVLLTKKDTFIERDEYVQLLFSCMQNWNPSKKIILQPPTIWKPKKLWTGKQVINSLLDSISGNFDGINMEKRTRTPGNAWGGMENVPSSVKEEEGLLVIRDNYICQGIIDKSQISDGQSFGLCHAIHELYGHHAASTFLTAIGQLLSTYLQSHGFSARMEDLILTQSAEYERKSIINNAFKKSVLKVIDVCKQSKTQNIGSYNEVVSAMKDYLLSDDKNEGKLDGELRGVLSGITNKVISNCYPFGSFIPFPINNFELMILAGAKGSTVNMAQIVACLGQQELEGHRVPRMASGKTLPCFSAYDPCSRAGGFVTQRFLTGLRPQEYYFHSMAGREGLVDTACKTSRSGYLQRCLIKGLETLHVSYDHTVRDANENIVQFLYGEDSLDTSKASYLDGLDATKFSFFANNKCIISRRRKDEGMFDADELEKIFDAKTESELSLLKTMHFVERNDDKSMDLMSARKYMHNLWKMKKKNDEKLDKYLPSINLFAPSLYFGSVSEAYFEKIKEFIAQNENEQIDANDFEQLMKILYVCGIVDCGEEVGILAAQSMGEPSTQMTLNTFHLAGFGDRNVTLGIPRIREILMTEGRTISTPDMSFWIASHIKKPMEAAIKLKNSLQPLPLCKLLTSRSIQGPNVINSKRIYSMELIIAIPKSLKHVSTFRVMRCLKKQFFPILLAKISKNASSSNKQIEIDETKMNDRDDEFEVAQQQNEQQQVNDNPDANDDESESAEDGDENDKIQKNEYSDDDEVESHSDEEKESVLDEDEDDEKENNIFNERGMPDLVTSDFSDNSSANEQQRNKNTKRRKVSSSSSKKKVKYENMNEFERELNAKFKCFRSVQIVIDEPRILCSLQVELAMNAEPVLLESLIDSVCKKSAFIRRISDVDAVHIDYSKNGNGNGSNWKIIVSGFNRSVFKIVEKFVDLNTFETNSIFAIFELFGIEAARNAIINELRSVLSAYGLDVSYRHLSLIADSMTRSGVICPMTRKSMAASTSPFLRITYEMAQKFMIDSCLNKDIDNISSPSSAIVLGQVGKFGTGSFDVKMDIAEMVKMQKQREQMRQECEEQQANDNYYSDEDEEDIDDDDDDML